MTSSRRRRFVAVLALLVLTVPLGALTARAQTGGSPGSPGGSQGSQGGQGGLFGGTRGSSTGGETGQSGVSQGDAADDSPATNSGPPPTGEGATHYNPCGPDGEQAVDEDGYLVFDEYGDAICTDGTVVPANGPAPDEEVVEDSPVDDTWYYEEYYPDEEYVVEG